MPRSFKHRIGCFLRREEGSISVETVIIFPLLMWAFMATYVYYDAYHSKTLNLKAAYTISDALSRETGYVTPSYITNLSVLQSRLTRVSTGSSLRLTVISQDPSSRAYRVRWSKASNGVQPLTSAQLVNMAGRLPSIPAGEVVVLVQNWVDYTSPFGRVMDDFTFENFVVTRPRFAPQLCWNDLDRGTLSTATC